jgi:carbon monoxide dehydrogenase subunit G
MELTGDMCIGAPRETVWAGLNDADILTRCIPGCEGIEVISSTEKAARVMVKVGPVRARFAGQIRMADVRPGEGCTMQFEGSGGAAGMARGQSEVELSDEDGGTRLRYSVQASVGGKLGQVGGRMIDAAAKQMADQFFAAFNKQLGHPTADADATQSGESTAPSRAHVIAPTMLPAAAAGAASSVAAPASSGVASERLRVLWFLLGSLSTGFGVWIASLLSA